MPKTPLTSLSQCKAAGIPVFPFGSPQLTAFHEAFLDAPVHVKNGVDGWVLAGGAWYARRTYPIMRRVYGKNAEGRQYVVDHGGCFTLNTLREGQVCPEMNDISPH